MKLKSSAIIAFLSILALIGCQITDKRTPGPPIPVSSFYIYGRLLHSDSTVISKAGITVCASSSEPCDTSASVLPQQILSDSQGNYNLVLGRSFYHVSEISQSFDVRLKLRNHDNYITPKPSILNIDFNINAPHDSLHVDFVVNDSL